MTKARLDEVLVARGFYPSRSRARDAILRGTVYVDGRQAAKPAQTVAPQSPIEIFDGARHYVSRSSLKLKGALDAFGIDVQGLLALDIGASTGGFTQVLLERGVSHVTAIDVGHGQLAQTLASDDRITSIEGLNARDLTADHLSHDIDIIVCDVSFISLRLALPTALELARVGSVLVTLIKPQFEVGRDAVGAGGIVSDEESHRRVCDEIKAFLVEKNWEVTGIVPSSIDGGDGNREYLIAARKR